ncbi:hypothetical protein RUM44_001318 [Polyplax serrata]|uniref:Uncharacterized protein n=1 Tax=Polyplax serrata TaxID=468196 RepID=A0ABR1AJR4_POLSC
MDSIDFSYLLTPEFWFQQFTSFDGVHTGVPTRTTPTLTPTTLRNIEQTFIELTRETERTEPHQNEAGFVPPVVQPITQGYKDNWLIKEHVLFHLCFISPTWMSPCGRYCRSWLLMDFFLPGPDDPLIDFELIIVVEDFVLCACWFHSGEWFHVHKELNQFLR